MEVSNVLPSMKPKMTVLAKVVIVQKSAPSISLDCLFDDKVITANGPQQITVGSYGDHFVEIVEGVEIGQQLKMS